MKLYQTYYSPFPTRVRLALYAKGIDFEIIEPPSLGESSGPKGVFVVGNPMGRVPVLVLDDGRTLPESEVICEYLEEVFPSPPLLPADPWQRAQVRLLTRLSDIYLVMAMVPLFNMIGKPESDENRPIVQTAVRSIVEALSFLDFYIGADGYAVGRTLTVADGALAPMLILSDEWVPRRFGCVSPLSGFTRLLNYWQAVQADPIVARVVTETRESHAARRRS
ncbi:MAG TPA: glutathione S-transferase family protein [Steroidobacteraceae bacterium]|jgi:glutathione S-transferase